MTYGKHVAEEDLALYSVRALAPDRNGEVQRHLDACVKCRGKLAEIISGLSLITLSSSPETSSSATKEILNRIKAEASPAPPPEADTIKAAVAKPFELRKWSAGWGWIAAAAAAAFAIYAGAREHALERELTALRYRSVWSSGQRLQGQQILDLLSSHTVLRMVLSETKAEAQPTAQVFYDKDRAALILIASNLHPLPANKSYMLWLIPAPGLPPVRAGFFRPDAKGNASLILPPLPGGVDAKTFGVTIEESFHAAVPASPFVLTAR